VLNNLLYGTSTSVVGIDNSESAELHGTTFSSATHATTFVATH
jgi:hypothetical protein